MLNEKKQTKAEEKKEEKKRKQKKNKAIMKHQSQRRNKNFMIFTVRSKKFPSRAPGKQSLQTKPANRLFVSLI